VWVSDPCPGSTHDVAALDASGLLEDSEPAGSGRVNLKARRPVNATKAVARAFLLKTEIRSLRLQNATTLPCRS